MAAKPATQKTAESAARKQAKGYKRIAVWVPAIFEKRFRRYVEKLTQEFESTKD